MAGGCSFSVISGGRDYLELAQAAIGAAIGEA